MSSVDPTDVVKAAVEQSAPPPKTPKDDAAPAKKSYTHCGNCRAEDKALKACTRCRKTAYCSRDCQAKDWKFHKRVCVVPKKKDDESKKPKKPAAAAAAASAPKPAPAASTSKSDPKSKTDGAADSGTVSDEEDAAVIQQVKKMGYRYHARTLDEKDTALIGDIKPKQLPSSASPSASTAPSAAPAPVASGAGSGSGAGAGSAPAASAPQGIPTDGPKSVSSASAWNHAGTFEERDLGAWFKDRLTDLVLSDAPEVDVGVGRLVATGFEDWEGSASVFMARGKVRRVFDAQFKLVVELRMAGDDLGAGSEPPEAPDGKKKKKKKSSSSKYPKALLAFHDVSNDCDGEYEGLVEWGSPPPRDDLKDVCRKYLRSDSQVLHKRVVDSINTVVEEFMAK